MKPEELFGVAIRVAGLISLMYVLGTGVMLIGRGVPWMAVAMAIAWALVSIWLLRGAPQLVRFAYPRAE